jgi:hypothetical protein
VLVQSEHGVPQPGTKVHIYARAKAGAAVSVDRETGPDGRAYLASVPPGRAYVSVASDGSRRSVGVETVAGRVTELVFTLPGGYAVEGVVRHADKGPLAGIQVKFDRRQAEFRDSYSATTDEEGRFRFATVPTGTYGVSLTGKQIGYHPRPRAELVVEAPGPVVREFVLGRVALRGIVHDPAGRCLDEVRVGLQEPLYTDTHTDAQGRFAFIDVPPGSYTMTLNKDGYGMRFVRDVRVKAGEAADLELVLQPAARLRIVFTDTAGNALPGRHGISIGGEKGATSLGTSVLADENGVAHYDRIVPGHYTLGTHGSKRHERVSQEVDIQPGQNEVRFVLTPTGEAGAISLTGTVRDKVTGRPIAGARVNLQSPYHSVGITDAKGGFSFAGLRPGSYTLWIAKDGYGIEFFRRVRVDAGETTRRDFELRPAATLHLIVTDAQGRPVVGSVILALDPLDPTDGTNVGTSVQADADGHATYRRIVPGKYRLRAIKEGVGNGSAEAVIGSGETTVRILLE